LLRSDGVWENKYNEITEKFTDLIVIDEETAVTQAFNDVSSVTAF